MEFLTTNKASKERLIRFDAVKPRFSAIECDK